MWLGTSSVPSKVSKEDIIPHCLFLGLKYSSKMYYIYIEVVLFPLVPPTPISLILFEG